MAVNMITEHCLGIQMCKRDIETDWTMRDYMHMALDPSGV